MENEKIEALIKHMEDMGETITEDEAEQLMDDWDYLVLTEDEADEHTRENIEDSLWAFNKSFLDCHSEAIREIPDKDFEAMQGKLCESFNKAVKSMIDDFDHFVEDAIRCDGRGHFLSTYDGGEYEAEVNGTLYYVYRLN